MRKGSKWMTKSDDSILELLSEADVALNFKGIEVNSERKGNRIPYSTIKRRIPKLVNAELVQTVDDEDMWYVITDSGDAYLEGDHTPPDLDS